jgi:P-type Mg2+ transporter
MPIKKVLRKLADQESHFEDVNVAVARASERLISKAMMGPDAVLAQLEASWEGLSEEVVADRLARFGKNEVAHEKIPTWYRQFVKAWINPFVGILVVLAVTAYSTEVVFAPPGEQEYASLIIITILVLISVLLTFAQEYQASKAADELLSLVQTMTTVQRPLTGRAKVATTQIVPGDIVHLAAGDIIPADVYLLATNNLSVNEAALTGESLPVEKSHTAVPLPDAAAQAEFRQTANPLDLDNIGFMGTHVVSGTAKVAVMATGRRTYFGAMSRELVGHHPPTSFDKGLNQVSLLLIRFMLVMVPIIFLINGLTKGDWFQALLFGLAVAVGLTPEMLPTIVTANLAKGTVEMARQKTIVKRLSAIQNLGAINILCTDKTGTLTHDSVGLEAYLNVAGERDAEVLRYAYLNSFHQTGLNNPMDEAVLAHEDAQGLASLAREYPKVAEIPFETARRRMSVVAEADGRHLFISKGATDEMLSISSSVQLEEQIVPLTDEMRA